MSKLQRAMSYLVWLLVLWIILASWSSVISAFRLNMGALRLVKGTIWPVDIPNQVLLDQAINGLRVVKSKGALGHETFRLIGIAYALKGKLDMGVQYWEQAKNQGNTLAKINLGRAYLKQSKWHEAVYNLDPKVCPDAWCIIEHVTSLMQENRAKDATDLLTTYIANYPDESGEPYFRLIGLYWGIKSPEMIREVLSKGLHADKHKESTEYTYYLALKKTLEKNDEEAALLLQASVGLHPNHYPSLHLLGQVYLRLNRAEDAVAILEKAVQLEPKREWTHYYLANAYLQTDKTDSAVDELWQAIVLKPNVELFLDRLADIYARIGQVCEEKKVRTLKLKIRNGNTIDILKEQVYIAEQCQ
ncbi:MAG: tetratricopeptide repeat protein [Caldilineaceae bacterium]